MQIFMLEARKRTKRFLSNHLAAPGMRSLVYHELYDLDINAAKSLKANCRRDAKVQVSKGCLDFPLHGCGASIPDLSTHTYNY